MLAGLQALSRREYTCLSRIYKRLLYNCSEFGLNIVYIKVGEDSSAGPLPAIRLSRRERYSQMTQYREWDIVQIYTGTVVYNYLSLL